VSGRLDALTVPALWAPALAAVRNASGPNRTVTLDASAVDYCDGAGLGLLVELRRAAEHAGAKCDVTGLQEDTQRQFNQFTPADLDRDAAAPPAEPSAIERFGRDSVAVVQDIRGMVSFVGEIGAAFVNAARHPRRVRWHDALVAAETAGVDALPIVVLVGFIIGLVMAFQSAMPMRQYGIEIYVANLVALSMLRELGPLLTAIVLAGRSGSAFAAELGTMKINEELDALSTMGLDPVRFLVVTRVLAATLAAPLLTLFANVVGLAGGAIVLMSLKYPFVTYYNQVVGAVTLMDLGGGLIKATVFGFLVSGVGCLRGLRTRSGASAVGTSTTSAVVSGIVLIALADAVFSVTFYILDI
jgi:phospholipid/cholesterol/gamma-HCH transport system permease protein